MGILLKEIFNEGKTSSKKICEDLYVVTEDFVAIIDGATNVSGRLIRGKAPGRFAAEIIQQTLLKARKDISLIDLLSVINKNLLDRYETFGMIEEIKKKCLDGTDCLFDLL